MNLDTSAAARRRSPPPEQAEDLGEGAASSGAYAALGAPALLARFHRPAALALITEGRVVVVRFERVLTVLRTHVFSQTTRRAHGVKHSTDMRHLPGSIHPCIKATAHDGAPHG